MITTSYFGNMRNISKDIRLISICRKPPEWFTGDILYQTTIPQREYNGETIISNSHFESIKKQVIIMTEKPVNKYSIKLLAPMSKMFGDFLTTGDEVEFERAYKSEVLSRLDPIRISEAFKERDACLLCVEPNDGRTCHRHFVRDWFNEANVEVGELNGKK